MAKDCYADVKKNGHITYYSDQTLSMAFDFLLSAGIVKPGIGNPGVGKRQLLEDTFREMLAADKQLAIPVD